MSTQLAPYRHSPLCPRHTAAPPSPCPRCADEWLGQGPPPPAAARPPWAVPPIVRRTFVAGLCAATAFGAVIGTAIGFVAGVSPAWAQMQTMRVRVHRVPPATRPGDAALAAATREPSAAASPSQEPAQPIADAPAPSPPWTAAPVGAPLAAVTPLLADLGEPTHDPDILLARVEGLARTGVAFVLQTRRLPANVVTDLRERGVPLSSTRILPWEQDGRVVGLEVFGPGPYGLFRAAGLENGDVILAVNGHDVTLPTSGWEPFPGDARAALVELLRGGEHRLQVVRW